MIDSYMFRARFIVPSAEAATQFSREAASLPAAAHPEESGNIFTALFLRCCCSRKRELGETKPLSSSVDTQSLFSRIAASRKITPAEAAILAEARQGKAKGREYYLRLYTAIQRNAKLASSLWHLFSSMQQKRDVTNRKKSLCRFVELNSHLTPEQKDEFQKLCPERHAEAFYDDDAIGSALLDRLGRFIELTPLVEELKQMPTGSVVDYTVLINELEQQNAPLLDEAYQLADAKLGAYDRLIPLSED